MTLDQQPWRAASEGRMRVLVVESNLGARDGIERALAEHCALEFAAGQMEALDRISKALPDVVVTEVDLEEGDGIALCMAIRRQAQTAGLPVMMLSARTAVQDRVAGFSAGADDYVVKPFDSRLLHARLRLLARIKGLAQRGA